MVVVAKVLVLLLEEEEAVDQQFQGPEVVGVGHFPFQVKVVVVEFQVMEARAVLTCQA